LSHGPWVFERKIATVGCLHQLLPPPPFRFSRVFLLFTPTVVSGNCSSLLFLSCYGFFLHGLSFFLRPRLMGAKFRSGGWRWRVLLHLSLLLFPRSHWRFTACILIFDVPLGVPVTCIAFFFFPAVPMNDAFFACMIPFAELLPRDYPSLARPLLFIRPLAMKIILLVDNLGFFHRFKPWGFQHATLSFFFSLRPFHETF